MTGSGIEVCAKTVQEGVIVSCHVRPGASRTECAGLYGESMKLSLKAPPVDGKANKELCRFFAEKCSVAKSAVTLVSGQTSRDKKILIAGISMEFLKKIFADE